MNEEESLPLSPSLSPSLSTDKVSYQSHRLMASFASFHFVLLFAHVIFASAFDTLVLPNVSPLTLVVLSKKHAVRAETSF